MTSTPKIRASLLAVAYLGIIVGANWAITKFGPVPVGFGLVAPAAVWLAGLAFTARDLLHDAGGRRVVLAAIAGGATLSALLADPTIAGASAAAFAFSELADFAVYSPIRRRRWLLAIVASNTVGLVADSLLFLWLAFGSLAFLPGQIVGKTWNTIATVLVLASWRRWRR